MTGTVWERARGAMGAWGRSGFESRPMGPCLAVALGLTLLVVGLLVLNDDYRGPDDDLGISLALSGLYPDGGQCLFTNAVLNGIIYQLNMAIPELNWFLVIERAAVAVAFFALSYLLLRHVPLGPALVCLGFIAYFIMPKCTLGSNFTVVAALCVMAGEVCFCVGIARRKLSPCVAGTVLVTLGFMWRALVLLLSAPFLALAFAGLLLRCGRGHRSELRRLLAWALASAAVVGLAVGGALAYDRAVWSDPHWAPWQEYNDARYSLVDYPTRDYEAMKDELAAIGVSESDYWLMRNWITADPDYITAERLGAVSSIAREPAADRSFVSSVVAEGRHLVKSPLLTVSLAFLVVTVLLLGRRRVLAVTALSLAGAFAACVLFRYTGRLPARVEYAVWLFSLLPCAAVLLRCPLPAPTGERPLPQGRVVVSAALGMLFAVLCAVGLGVKWGPAFNVERIDQFAKESAFVEDNALINRFSEPGVVYVWDTTTFTQVEKELKYRHLPPKKLMDSAVFAGGWTQGSPLVRAHNEDLGVPNPLRALIDRPDTYFVTRRKHAIEQITSYLREHYDDRATAAIVDEVPLKEKGSDPLLVVRFSTDTPTDGKERG